MQDDVKKALEELEQTFAIVHRVATHQSDAAYMSIPADPKRDADLRHMVAVEALRAHIDAEPARLAAALEEQREALGLVRWPVIGPFLVAMAGKLDANRAKKGGREGWQNQEPGSLARRVIEEAEELEHAVDTKGAREILLEAADVANMAMMVADASGALDATPLTATPQADRIAELERERDSWKATAEQEARDDVMTAEQRLKFWEENPHACPVHFGARTACGQCHDSTAQQLTNLRIEHEAVVNEVETAEARVKELLALGEQRCDGIGCDWGEECVRLVAERDALKARVRKLEAELDEGVRVLMGVLSSPGFVDLAQSDRDALKTFLAKASTALKEGAR